MEHSNESAVRHKAKLLRELHADGTLVLPNAWDAASAAVIAEAGAAAIATTSAGWPGAWASRDGEQLPRAELVAAIDADGRGHRCAADRRCRDRLRRHRGGGGRHRHRGAGRGCGRDQHRGCAGRRSGRTPPRSLPRRIRAARTAAVGCGVPDFVINARTDVYMRRIGDPETRLDEVLRRAAEYAEAGGDCLFVPGLADLAVLESLVALIPPADQRVHRSRPAHRRAAAGGRGAPGQRRTGPGTGGLHRHPATGRGAVSAGQLTAESPGSTTPRSIRCSPPPIS